MSSTKAVTFLLWKTVAFTFFKPYVVVILGETFLPQDDSITYIAYHFIAFAFCFYTPSRKVFDKVSFFFGIPLYKDSFQEHLLLVPMDFQCTALGALREWTM